MTYMASVVLRPVRMGRNLDRPACAVVSPPGRPGRRGARRAEERLRVYGHRYFAVPSQVLLLCNLQRSLNALGLHRHAERKVSVDSEGFGREDCYHRLYDNLH